MAKGYKNNIALSMANNKGQYKDKKGITKKDKFTQLYISMLESDEYLSLTTTQQQLLTFMVSQTHNKELIKDYGMNAFYFNRAIQKKFRLTNKHQNIKNIKALEEKGFIKILENNKHNKRKNIYSLSSKWYTK